MPLRCTVDAVVLRTIDVGEADRFCVLFTRERGRRAARATAVRKTSCRMGGTVLPMQRALIDITEQGNGFLITGASQAGPAQSIASTFNAFMEHTRGIDMLLALTEDEDPMPEVFDLLCSFLACAPDDLPGLLPAFQTRFLHLLGLLPSGADTRIQNLPPAVQAFLQAAASPLPFDALAELTPHHPQLVAFIEGLIDEHAARPMKSKLVVTY
jgi:recombinational DNA repair protein (RecF pathway)